MTKLSVTEVADFLKGTIEGKQREWISGISKIDDGKPGSLTFLANIKYVDYLTVTLADVVLINQTQAIPNSTDKTFIRVQDPYLSFCEVLNHYFNPAMSKTGIHASAHISKTAEVGENVYLGENVVIGEDVRIGEDVKIFANTFIGDGVQIGSGTWIYANVSIYHGSLLGKRNIIHSGTTIGSDGFGHAPKADGSYVKIPQIGNVIIEDDVEIGANCAIDRATLGSTRIGKGVKLDNLIQVAHNVEIGENTVIAAQSGISGSTILGNQCVIGGQVGFAGHLKIANGTQVGAQSGLNKDIEEENSQLFGSPVMPLKDALRSHLLVKNLPEMRQKLRELERLTKELKEQIDKH